MNLVQNYCVNSDCYRNARKITIRGAMLHSIGTPQPNPDKIQQNWNQPGKNACTHYIIGPDKIIQMLPDNYRSWHCGGAGNDYLISAEMTEPNTIKYTGGANWVELGDGTNTKAHVLATYKNAVELFAYLAQKHGFDPSNSNVVMSHSEGHRKGIASNHGDVEHLWRHFGLTMDKFRSDVKTMMAGGTIDVDITEPVKPPVEPSTPPQTSSNVIATYRVRTKAHGWLPEVTEYKDYAGWQDSPVTDVAIKVSAGSVKYRVHVYSGGWLGWVTGYNLSDYNNGYAGNGKPIDAIQVYYYTPDSIRPYQRAIYRVAPIGRGYYPEQIDTNTGSGMDGYAAAFGKQIGKFQLRIE